MSELGRSGSLGGPWVSSTEFARGARRFQIAVSAGIAGFPLLESPIIDLLTASALRGAAPPSSRGRKTSHWTRSRSQRGLRIDGDPRVGAGGEGPGDGVNRGRSA